MSSGGHTLLGRLVSRQPPPIRDLYSSAEPPEWATKAATRPSHHLSLQARVAQSRVIPLDVYRVQRAARDVVVTAELPGLRASEVFLAVDKGLLTICSEPTEGTGDRPGGSLWQVCREMRRGRYSRTLALPEGLQVDRWSATFDEDSVLRIRIPRSA
jgi:HSP20 family molecular chaperone IbpA